MYENRTVAGHILAEELSKIPLIDPLLLAIPRGGILVAAPVAAKLQLPLDILITKKIGHPHNQEVAIGAVMPDGTTIWNEEALSYYHIQKSVLKPLAEEKLREIQQCFTLYTGSVSQSLNVANKTVIVIDDGIATGYTIQAAIRWLKNLSPAKIILAVPVAPPEVLEELSAFADRLICPLQPLFFQAVSMHYQDFPQNTNSEVIHILKQYKAN